MAQVLKDRIRWDGDDWMAGFIPQYSGSSTSLAATLTGGKGFAFSRNVDPYRSPGYVQPGGTGTSATNNSVVTTYLKNGIPNGDSAYMVGGALLHKMTISTNTLVSDATWPHTIVPHGHASTDAQDVALYYIGAVKYLFYSWNDNTDGDVGRYDLSATFDDDWGTTVPTGFSATGFNNTNPKPMIVGDDNRLYIANGNKIASVDGQTGAAGTINYNALDLPNDYVITSFAKLPNYLVIFAFKSAGQSGTTFFRSEATAFIWDYVSDSFTRAYDLDSNYVNGGFNYKNTVGCFVQGNNPQLGDNKLSRMMLFNGSEFEPKFRFRQNVPQHGGVEVISNTIYWLAGLSGGNAAIYQYGSPHEGLDNKFNYISEGAGESSGMLREFSSGNLFVSSGATTTGGLQKFSGTGYASSSQITTPLVNVATDEFRQIRAKTIKIYWGNTSSDHTVSVNIITDRGDTTTTILSNFSGNTSTLTKYEEDSSGGVLPRFDNIALNISWSTTASANEPPIIQAVEVFYEAANIN